MADFNLILIKRPMIKMSPLLNNNDTDFHATQDGTTEGCPKVGRFSFKCQNRDCIQQGYMAKRPEVELRISRIPRSVTLSDFLQEKLISRGTLSVHMFNLSCDKVEHMHTNGLHCEIKQCKNFVRCAQLGLQKLSERVQKIFSQT